MSSEVLIPQVTLDNEGYSLTATADDIAISVRNVGGCPQDRLRQAFLWGRKKLYRGEVMERAIVFVYCRELS